MPSGWLRKQLHWRQLNQIDSCVTKTEIVRIKKVITTPSRGQSCDQNCPNNTEKSTVDSSTCQSSKSATISHSIPMGPCGKCSKIPKNQAKCCLDGLCTVWSICGLLTQINGAQQIAAPTLWPSIQVCGLSTDSKSVGLSLCVRLCSS